MSSDARQLLALFERLSPADRATLLAFAGFLVSRPAVAPPAAAAPPAPVTVPEPEAIARPEQESLVAGLKRLSRTYPMLDKSEMLSATSDLVATALLQGSEHARIIDQLEEIFAEHYRQFRARLQGD